VGGAPGGEDVAGLRRLCLSPLDAASANDAPAGDEQLGEHGRGDDAVGSGYNEHGFVVLSAVALEGGVLDCPGGSGVDFLVPVEAAVGDGVCVAPGAANPGLEDAWGDELEDTEEDEEERGETGEGGGGHGGRSFWGDEALKRGLF